MTSDGHTLLHRARALVPDYLRLLEAFVNLDSGTHDRDLVQQAGEMIAAEFAAVFDHLEWVRSPEPQIADTYIARLDGSSDKTVLMLGHHDTVYAAGTTRERPFAITGGRAHGPGVMDMKGGVVLGLFAVRLLRELGVEQIPSVIFVGNPDEEIGSPTSRSIIEQEAVVADLVLVLEPGREPGSIQTTRKGVGMYELVVAGVSAHAGARPEDGRSAVLELAHKTIALHDLNDFASGTTVNVGVVLGGTRRNVVAERAEALIDLRAKTAASAAAADEVIREIADTVHVEGTHSTVTGGMNRPPMEKTERTERALDVGRSIVAEMGLEFLEVSSGGGSDGNFTAALGVPTLDGLGPVGRNAHSPDEWLDVTSIAERMALVAGLIARGAD
jgi:glutamate carboxypeptidase